jgi:ArsR family transcriptional regulator
MEQIGKIAEIYKAFSDPTRLKILKLLADHKFQCVNAITRKLDVTQSAVSQHLRILRQANLVRNERMSNQIHYSLNREKLAEFNEWVSKELGKDFLSNR